HQPGAPAVGPAGRGAAVDHDAGRALPLPARGGAPALPADQRQFRAARSPAGEGEEGSQEGAAGGAGAGGFRTVPGEGPVNHLSSRFTRETRKTLETRKTRKTTRKHTEKT